MTKRELLLRVCEQPGFDLPDESSTLRAAEELTNEGWIAAIAIGGNTVSATSKALDEYPLFLSQEDISSTNGEGSKVAAPVAQDMISEDRLVRFVEALIHHDVPLNTIVGAALSRHRESTASTVQARTARDIVEIIIAA